MSSPQLKHLGQKSSQPYDTADAALLEVVPNPFADRTQNPNNVTGTIHIQCPEFTCLCPITGQPDFATILIDYTPDELLVESKSLKIYLASFRQQGQFHEAAVNKIANDLINLLQPKALKVEGRFTPRGGIPLWPVADYRKDKIEDA